MRHGAHAGSPKQAARAGKIKNLMPTPFAAGAAGGAVHDFDAALGEGFAKAIGCRKILIRAGGNAFGDEGVDFGGGLFAERSAKPVFWIVL